MGWLKRLQNKPQKEKLRIIWVVVAAVTIFLIAAWVLASRYSKNTPKDTSLFQVISRGFNDLGNSLKKK